MLAKTGLEVVVVLETVLLFEQLLRLAPFLIHFSDSITHFIYFNMVYFRITSFKTGIGPSPLSRLRVNNIFIGREKLDLAKTRIFGNMIGGNGRTGITF